MKALKYVESINNIEIKFQTLADILLHLTLNNNLIESLSEDILAIINENECFSYQLIAPIYDFNKNHEDFSFFTYIAIIGLWLVSLSKLILKYNNGKIQNFQDLVTL